MTTPAGPSLFIGLRGLTLDAAAQELLDTVQPGGVILFARNIDNADQLRALTAALHARGLRVGIDQEGGRVNRLRNIVGDSPRDGRTIGRWLRDFGIDISFAPVLDLEIYDAATDNALRERCWGRTPAEVIAGAGQFLDDLQATGVTGCLKHFPGLGGATLDSHEALPVIERSRAELADDLRPFAALLPRAAAVMVSHGVYPALDSRLRPAAEATALAHLITLEERGAVRCVQGTWTV
jgi:beta-N-acetylhexosaminidase